MIYDLSNMLTMHAWFGSVTLFNNTDPITARKKTMLRCPYKENSQTEVAYSSLKIQRNYHGLFVPNVITICLDVS